VSPPATRFGPFEKDEIP